MPITMITRVMDTSTADHPATAAAAGAGLPLRAFGCLRGLEWAVAGDIADGIHARDDAAILSRAGALPAERIMDSRS